MALVSGTGFDAGGGLGAMRRNTLCAVYQYVQTIFDFSSVSVADPITIEIQATPAFGAVTYLAAAGPVYPGSAGTPGIYNGSVLNHVLMGSSPNPALFDGTLVVNLVGYNFYSGLPLPVQSCRYDLFSVCLHEVGHQLGFGSLLTEDGGFNPISSFGSNQYTLFDWQNIWHGDITTATFEKIVTGTLAAPQINPAIASPANYLRDEKLWLNNNGRFLDNLPLYSGTYWPSYAMPGLINLTPGSVASHMDGEYLSFTQRLSLSPGFRKPYSMQPYFDDGEARREFTEQEIRIFLQLGYLLNPVYATSFSINGTIQNQLIINNNRTPFTTKPVTSGNAPTTADMSYPDLVQTADFLPMVNNGAPLIISLATDGTIQDLDVGDIISVEDNTIYNIRGCGNAGNNHNQVSVDPTGTIITFIPRPNFIGRAQFGFYLFDGKERGSFMIYTIDVIPGPAFVNTPNVNTPLGNPELIVNGDFEEGTEVRRKNSGALDESILNTNITLRREEGLYYGGDEFADAHPLQYTSWLFTSGNGIIIGNLFKECFQPVTPVRFGHPAFSFPNPLWNNPVPVTGSRYAYIRNNHNYNTLSVPLQQCRRYVATFDVNFVNTGLAVGSVYTFNLDVNSIINFPTAPSLQTTPVNIIVGAGWQTITVPFTYCSATPGNFLNFVGSGVKVYYDNVSLIEDLSPTPPLNVSITNSLPTYCASSGSSSTLTATVANGLYAVTYSWMPGGATTASITVSPVATTTYTLIVDDGCRNTVSNTTVTVTPLPVATFSYSGTPYCQNATDPSPSGAFSGGGTFTSTAGLSINSTNWNSKSFRKYSRNLYRYLHYSCKWWMPYSYFNCNNYYYGFANCNFQLYWFSLLYD